MSEVAIPILVGGKEYQAYLVNASAQVLRELGENPNAQIEVSPDVAEHLGCFEESAMSAEDAREANLDHLYGGNYEW